MPMYDYKCERCEACFEVKQSYDDKSVVICHVCGGEAKRQFSPVPILFKGSGFYITDHRANNSNISTKIDTDTTTTVERINNDTKSEKKSDDKKPDIGTKDTSSASTKKSEGES